MDTTDARSRRPGPDEYASYYARYVERVPDGDILATLERQLEGTRRTLLALPPALADHAYAPGKWTVKEVVGHVCDAERVFAYRVLRFARADPQPLPSFDENAWVPAGRFAERELSALVDELGATRRATLALLAGLTPEAWRRRGTASGWEISVAALAWIIAGHELHHLHILETRYLQAATPARPRA